MASLRSLHRPKFASLLLCALMGVFFPRSAAAVVLYENDFEDDPIGTYTAANLAADWNGTSSSDGVDEGRVSITDNATAIGNKSLRIMYPQGESNRGKSQWKLALGGAFDEVFVSYRIRFDDGFNFVRGGKLPGLSGGADNSGGNQPNGTDGWSARMMWRTNGSGGSPTRGDTANMVQYTYHPDQPTEFGDDMRWDDTTPAEWQVFESGKWYHLQHRVVMNTPGSSGTPGQHDGILQAWLDGKQVLDRQDIRFRDTSLLKIDNFYFSTFFGGSSATWEATKDEYVDYDDFVIATEFIITPGDFNQDGKVDGSDLGLWTNAYGTGANGDANGDLDSDGDDFLAWQQHYTGDLSTSLAAASAVPEPSTAGALLLAIVFIFSQRHGDAPSIRSFQSSR